MTPTERTAAISKVIEEVAGAYCRRVWWADKVDLMQEAWLEVLSSLERKAVPDEWLKGTVYRIASRRVAQYLWESSSPATGARGGKQFQGLRRAGSLALSSRAGDGPAPDARVREAEAQHAVEEAREALFWRVAELYAEALEAAGQQARGLLFEAVCRVLIDGAASTDAARDMGSALPDVYAETARVRRLIVEDVQARELLEEISEWRSELET